MATAQIFLAPIPVRARDDHRPPNDALSIPNDVWSFAMEQIQLPPGSGSAFNGRFPDAQVPHQGGAVAINEIASRIGAAVASFKDTAAGLALTRNVSVSAWTFYYKYLDRDNFHVVAQYAVAETTASATSPWYIDKTDDQGTTHTFLVTAVARVAIPRN